MKGRPCKDLTTLSYAFLPPYDDRLGEPQVPGRGSGPQFKYRPPRRGLGFLERPRLHDALAAAADSRRVTLVPAPAGYGKSTVLADWVRDSEPACAWLSLDRFDTEAARLFHGVVRALQAAAGKRPLPGNNAQFALDQRLARDRVASYDHLLGALELLTEPLVLVIDEEILDCRLAVELHSRPDGGMLLEACLRSGLFISERELRGNESVYRWHPLFAAQCRRILERRDPILSQRLHRVAARCYQCTDVWESVAQVLRGRAPGLAATTIGEHWLELVLRNGAHSLEEVCQDLPAPWCEDPEVLLIRSVCRALDGDNAAASSLTRSALGRTAALDAARRRRFHQCRTIFDPAPDGARLEPGTSPAYFPGESAGAATDGFPTTSSGLFLLARAEFRVYRMGTTRPPSCSPPPAQATRNGWRS